MLARRCLRVKGLGLVLARRCLACVGLFLAYPAVCKACCKRQARIASAHRSSVCLCLSSRASWAVLTSGIVTLYQAAKTYMEKHYATFEDCDLPTLVRASYPVCAPQRAYGQADLIGLIRIRFWLETPLPPRPEPGRAQHGCTRLMPVELVDELVLLSAGEALPDESQGDFPERRYQCQEHIGAYLTILSGISQHHITHCFLSGVALRGVEGHGRKEQNHPDMRACDGRSQSWGLGMSSRRSMARMCSSTSISWTRTRLQRRPLKLPCRSKSAG